MARFYVGQPVVCVNDKFIGRWWLIANRPRRGEKYHVRGYVDCPSVPGSGYPPLLLLREITNASVPYRDNVRREISFGEPRFEPITESQVQAIIAIATDAPEEITRELERETEDI